MEGFGDHIQICENTMTLLNEIWTASGLQASDLTIDIERLGNDLFQSFVIHHVS